MRSRSVERAKEVGIRKMFGSGRQSIIGQFLLEAVLISFSSTILAILLIISFLPVFNSIAAKSLSIVSLLTPVNCVAIFIFSTGVGLFAGLYPAFVLSSFKPILVLKGKFNSNKYGMALRNSLVVFQFSISVILIVCTIIVSRQMDYMTGDKLGFKKDHVIEISQTGLPGDNSQSFKDEIATISGIETVSTASTFPGRQGFLGSVFQPLGSKESICKGSYCRRPVCLATWTRT